MFYISKPAAAQTENLTFSQSSLQAF